MTDNKATQKSASEQPTPEELSDEQLKGVAGGAGRPPSGDLNPSDLANPTVDTSEVINPHAK